MGIGRGEAQTSTNEAQMNNTTSDLINGGEGFTPPPYPTPLHHPHQQPFPYNCKRSEVQTTGLEAQQALTKHK